MTVRPRRFDRFGSRHTLRKTVARIGHSICHRQTPAPGLDTAQPIAVSSHFSLAMSYHHDLCLLHTNVSRSQRKSLAPRNSLVTSSVSFSSSLNMCSPDLGCRYPQTSAVLSRLSHLSRLHKGPHSSFSRMLSREPRLHKPFWLFFISDSRRTLQESSLLCSYWRRHVSSLSISLYLAWQSLSSLSHTCCCVHHPTHHASSILYMSFHL